MEVLVKFTESRTGRQRKERWIDKTEKEREKKNNSPPIPYLLQACQQIFK